MKKMLGLAVAAVALAASAMFGFTGHGQGSMSAAQVHTGSPGIRCC
jgi:hypothetical protein